LERRSISLRRPGAAEAAAEAGEGQIMNHNKTTIRALHTTPSAGIGAFGMENGSDALTYCGEEEVWFQAAEEGNLSQLQEIRQQMEPNFPWDDRTCYLAARWGHLAVLKWLHSLNLPCITAEETWNFAIEGGDLEIIIWLQEHGCQHLTEKSCFIAAESNNLEILKWLRSFDPPCPWNKKECVTVAKEFENLEVVEWLESTGS
jgi:hypothetical protein